MAEFFRSGRVVDAILGFMLCELLLLILVRINGAPLFRPREILWNFAAGAALLLALRAAARASDWPQVALWLFTALLCHLADLAIRRSMKRTQ